MKPQPPGERIGLSELPDLRAMLPKVRLPCVGWQTFALAAADTVGTVGTARRAQ